LKGHVRTHPLARCRANPFPIIHQNSERLVDCGSRMFGRRTKGAHIAALAAFSAVTN
jgi:hypothetical protein